MTSARSRDALWVRHPFCPHPRDPRRRGTQHREELGGTEHGTGNRETWALAVATHIRALCTLLHSLSATFELDAVDMPVLRMRTLRLERVTAPTFWERVSGRVGGWAPGSPPRTSEDLPPWVRPVRFWSVGGVACSLDFSEPLPPLHARGVAEICHS